MKRTRSRVGLIVGLSVLAFLVLCGLAFKSYVGSSDDYVRTTLPRLLESWNRADLRRELNREHFNDKEVDHIALLGPKRLGKLKSFNLHRATFSSTQIKGRSAIRMCYSIPATFSKAGSIGVMFYIAQTEGRWQIVDFDVSNPDDPGNNLFRPSPAFVPPRTPVAGP